MKKLIFEMQGPEVIPDDLKDEVLIRNDKGELVKMEVEGDDEC